MNGPSARQTTLSVFTKPWKTMPLEDLAEWVRKLGFDGVELPVREGFQVVPERVERDLPEAARIFASRGVRIQSVAGPIDRRTIGACASAGVGLIRICLGIDPAKGYRACIDAFQRQCQELARPLEDGGVRIGLQNHHGNDIGSAIGLIHALEGIDPRHAAAVLDVAHCALAGETEEIAIDIAWPRLGMVNLKNGYRQRIDDPAGDEARWKVKWVGAKEGLASWSKTIGCLLARGYHGPICLTAEYSDAANVDRLIGEDLAYAKSLLQYR